MHHQQSKEQEGVSSAVCYRHLAATSAGPPESGSASSSTDFSPPWCQHSANFCTGKQAEYVHCHQPTLQEEVPVHMVETYLVTHMVFWHWLTRVSLSSSLRGLTVMSSNVLGRAQNSLLAGSTASLVQLDRLMRPMGF